MNVLRAKKMYSECLGVDLERLFSKSRERDLVLPRRVLIFYLKNFKELDIQAISSFTNLAPVTIWRKLQEVNELEDELNPDFMSLYRKMIETDFSSQFIQDLLVRVSSIVEENIIYLEKERFLFRSDREGFIHFVDKVLIFFEGVEGISEGISFFSQKMRDSIKENNSSIEFELNSLWKTVQSVVADPFFSENDKKISRARLLLLCFAARKIMIESL